MKIGIATPWFERGAAYASLMMYRALGRRHELHVFALAGKPAPVGPEWRVPNLTSGRPEAIFSWAQQRTLDVLILCERQDRFPERDFKILTLLMWEWVEPSQIAALNAHFDGVLAPTTSAFQRFRDLGLEKVFHVPWGADLDVFRPRQNRGPLQFFHPAGYGGVAGRRGTQTTKKAFEAADTGDARLLVTAQRSRQPSALRDGLVTTLYGTLPREVLARHYRESDIALLPSKWEGLGLTFLEAMASGLAIVTVDAPPMNEYVRDGFNGLLCRARFGEGPPGVQVPRAEIDRNELVAKIEVSCKRPEMAREMGRNSRQRAEEQFDWAKNGEVLDGVVRRIVDG